MHVQFFSTLPLELRYESLHTDEDYSLKIKNLLPNNLHTITPQKLIGVRSWNYGHCRCLGPRA